MDHTPMPSPTSSSSYTCIQYAECTHPMCLPTSFSLPYYKPPLSYRQFYFYFHVICIDRIVCTLQNLGTPNETQQA